ncbi:MAG: hypothetical protein H6678_02880 [Candidatus Delongbacteria bacterium]|nr:hypothetical protein [Candidatus Delongbacteria bacterium]
MTRQTTTWTALAVWAGIASATCLSPLYVLPEHGMGWSALLLGVAVAARWIGGGAPAVSRPQAAALLLSALALLWLLPSAWMPGVVLLAGGALALLIPGGSCARTGWALVFAGAAGTLGHALILPASYLHAMLPRDAITGLLAQAIARAGGSNAAMLGADWVLGTPDEMLPFSLGGEWTGLYYRVLALGLFLVFWLRALLASSSGARPVLSGLARLGILVALASLWGALIFVFQSQLAPMLYDFEVPWSPLYQALTGLPPILLAGLLASGLQPAAVSELAAPSRKSLLLAFGAALCFWLAVFLELPLGANPGRVLVDDGHSDWEWTGDPMNTTQFGTRTTYNYHGLGRLLARHYDSRINFDPLTPALLDTVDVLILKTPTRAYSEDEIRSVLDFVHAGGGLYLISDHTDVFGMSTFLNELTRHFGFIYNKDTVFDLLSTEDQFWQQDDVIAHPAFQNLPWYRYLTGCSIRPGWNTRCVSRGPQTGSDLLSYATSNFFDVYYPRTELRWGNLFQVVSVRYGKGKVLGFSDSTTYSNFAMFLEGRLEHLMGIVGWLNQKSLPVDERWIFGLLALLLGLGALRRGGTGRVDWLLALALTAALVIPLVKAINASVYTMPERRHELPGVVLDTGLSRIELPAKNKLDHDDPLNMETFYVWLYRSGDIPERASQTLFPGTRQYILLNPMGAPAPDFRKELDLFMKEGGQVLVASMPGQDCGDLNDWLRGYGIELGEQNVRDARLVGSGTRFPVYLENARQVLGGTPFYSDERGMVLASEVAVGQGMLRVSGLAEGFNNAHLGRYDSIPSDLAYEYLQIYYRHTGMSGGDVVADQGVPVQKD